MNIQLTSPELSSLNRTRESLDAKERLVKKDATALRKRIMAGGHDDPEDTESNIAMILSGGDIAFTPDLKEQLATAMRQWRAIDDAKEALKKQIHNAKRAAAVKVVARLKPEHDAIMKRLVSSIIEVHSAHAELFSMKRELINQEVGIFGNVCELMPDFLDVPTNSYSPMADFCREAVKAGFMKAVPVQLRIAA